MPFGLKTARTSILNTQGCSERCDIIIIHIHRKTFDIFDQIRYTFAINSGVIRIPFVIILFIFHIIKMHNIILLRFRMTFFPFQRYFFLRLEPAKYIPYIHIKGAVAILTNYQGIKNGFIGMIRKMFYLLPKSSSKRILFFVLFL